MILQKTIDRFWRKVIKQPSGCWEWTASKDSLGYGWFAYNAVKLRAHRFSAKYFAKLDIKNKIVCHTCDNPSCVNPDHLFVGSHEDNMQDMKSKNRAWWQNGNDHPRTIWKSKKNEK